MLPFLLANACRSLAKVVGCVLRTPMSQAAARRRSAAEAGPSGSREPSPHTPLERKAFTQAVMNKRFLPDVEARALYCSLRTLTSGAPGCQVKRAYQGNPLGLSIASSRNCALKQ